MKKNTTVIFTLGSPAISGGTNVILEHASRLIEQKMDVYIVTTTKVSSDDYKWHNEAHKLKWVTYDEIKEKKFDIAIATWWKTVYDLYKVKADKYVYFVQSIESKFYKDYEVGNKILAELTYSLNLKIITEATWIKEYLERKFGLKVYLVKNGIRKDIFSPDGETFTRLKKGLRVLIEGPIDVEFKNVLKTIELVNQAKQTDDEIWLLTSSNISKQNGVNRVFSRIPMNECGKIYRSCDVIVKLSYVEGMFGPPLEMFHCGGTAIVYDVTGHDEYIVHEKNGLVIKTDDENGVVAAIKKMHDSTYLNKLKKEALKTASAWLTWEMSSQLFYEALVEILTLDSISNEVLENQSKFFLDIYSKYENKHESIKKQLGNFLRKKNMKIYKLYRKMIRKPVSK